MHGIVGGTIDWINDTGEDNTTLTQWGAGLLVILVLSFLWATVIKQIVAA